MITRKLSEHDIEWTALYIMYREFPNPINTTDLKNRIITILQPGGENLDPLYGRPDEKITQIIRNLKSHKNISSNIIFKGFATCDGNGDWLITGNGIIHINNHIEKLLNEDLELHQY